jgi:hypothetical protein
MSEPRYVYVAYHWHNDERGRVMNVFSSEEVAEAALAREIEEWGGSGCVTKREVYDADPYAV